MKKIALSQAVLQKRKRTRRRAVVQRKKKENSVWVNEKQWRWGARPSILKGKAILSLNGGKEQAKQPTQKGEKYDPIGKREVNGRKREVCTPPRHPLRMGLGKRTRGRFFGAEGGEGNREGGLDEKAPGEKNLHILSSKEEVTALVTRKSNRN